MYENPCLFNTGFGGTCICPMVLEKEESEIVLTAIVFWWWRTNNQNTSYLRIFKSSTICSKHQEDSTCAEYVEKKIAGTVLGSCISWILNLVLKSAVTCWLTSIDFRQVKKGEFWRQVRSSGINPAPKIVHTDPNIPSPVWSIRLGAPVTGLWIKCWLDRCALTLPGLELHTPKQTSFQHLKRCNSIRGVGFAGTNLSQAEAATLLDVSGERLKWVPWVPQ